VGSELVNPVSLPTYTEIFNRQFPFYLSIGMTYDQYWNDDCLLTKYYREAQEIRNDRKNQELWLQGLYIYDALTKVAPALHAMKPQRPSPYPEKPYPITKEAIERDKEEREKAQREKAKAVFTAWAARLNLPEEVNANE